jgi:hypothetical protein
MTEAHFAVHQEPDEVATSQVWRTGAVGCLIAAIAVFFGGWLVASTGGLRLHAAAPEVPRAAPSAIALIEQTPLLGPGAGLDQKERQRRELASWGWADREAGVARIPIERAIDLVVREESR